MLVIIKTLTKYSCIFLKQFMSQLRSFDDVGLPKVQCSCNTIHILDFVLITWLLKVTLWWTMPLHSWHAHTF